MATMVRMLEENGWGAALDRPEVCGAGEGDEWNNAELGVEEQSKQESEEEAGGGDLLPKMDWAEPLRSGSRLASGLLRISGWGRAACGEPVLSGVEGLRRTGKQKLEKPSEGAGITMVVWVGDQEQERDGQQDERRRHAASPHVSVSPPTYGHLPPPQDQIESDRVCHSAGIRTVGVTHQRCLILSQKTGVSSFEQMERHSDEDTTRVGLPT